MFSEVIDNFPKKQIKIAWLGDFSGTYLYENEIKDLCEIFLKNLDLVYGNAVDIYKNETNIDLIYLDPMYPDSKKNTARAGSMNDIKSILKIEAIKNLEDQIFFDFKKQEFKKIVLKRPIKSKIIDTNLNYQVKGKSTRFDVYI